MDYLCVGANKAGLGQFRDVQAVKKPNGVGYESV
jgi:hypothetical protein